MSTFRNLVISLVVFILLTIANQALAVPNFNNGFSGWSGQLSGNDVAVADLTLDPHFSLNGNIATISYSDISDLYWNFTLSQNMLADQLSGAGYHLNMSFYLKLGLGLDLNGQPSTFDNHIISATLGSDALINTGDQAIRDRLLAGDKFTADITNFAGSSSLLAFTISDFDYSVTDSLQIGDFSFSQVAPIGAPVPEPSTVLLFGAGLAGLAFYRKRAKR